VSARPPPQPPHLLTLAVAPGSELRIFNVPCHGEFRGKATDIAETTFMTLAVRKRLVEAIGEESTHAD